MVKVRSPLDNTSTLLSVKLGDRVNEAPVDEEAIIGCVMAGHDGRRGYLQHLVVLPEYRRQGIGAALVHTCLAALAQQGIDKTHIFVFADNIPGNAFWRAQGWIPREEINMYSFIYSGAENA
ncbi:MAG: GNAT family N-acetyltransferase [Anaerolineae bacterium]|nr:GNAT family N-acetyltransferase [Anaerolineae bacterium]